MQARRSHKKRGSAKRGSVKRGSVKRGSAKRVRLSRKERISRRLKRARNSRSGKHRSMYGFTICPGISVSQGDTNEDVLINGKTVKAVKKCKIPGSNTVFRIDSDSECAEPDKSMCATSLSSVVNKVGSSIGSGLKGVGKVVGGVVGGVVDVGACGLSGGTICNFNALNTLSK